MTSIQSAVSDRAFTVRVVFAALVAAVAVLAWASTARAELTILPDSFKADAFKADAATPETRAGARPDLGVTEFEFEERAGGMWVSGLARDTTVKLPPGFVGFPESTPKCSRTDFDRFNDLLSTKNTGGEPGICPNASQVGVLTITGELPNGDQWGPGDYPVYNLEPRPGVLADLGVFFDMVPAHIEVRVDPQTFGVVAEVKKAPHAIPVRKIRVALWGIPSAIPSAFGNNLRGCGTRRILPFAACPVTNTPRVAFLRNPSRCGVAQTSLLAVSSWEQPDVFAKASYDAAPLVECDRLTFSPTTEVATSSAKAGGPTGLSVRLSSPQNDDPDGLGTPPIRDVRVELPDGMAVNPSSADGLAACSDEQLGLGTDNPIGCPDASKIGTATAVSPALAEPVPASVYLRSQASSDPMSGDMYRLALVMNLPERGLLLKLPGSATADPQTGKLVATFKDNPQLPVSKIDVALKAGARAPVSNPDGCGTHTATTSLTSWASDAPVVSNPVIATAGCEGGFGASLKAGVESPVAGGSSPLSMIVNRSGGEVLKSVDSVKLPKGLLGMVGKVSLCPEAQAAAGSCGGESRIGHTQVAAGAAGQPLWVPQAGKEPTAVHLSGPYKGAPYSLSIVVPAQAGPFDLGKVVVRSALRVDPETAQVTAETDSLPHILGGVPLKVREIRVLLDRPGFVRSPTSCATKSIDASFASLQGTRAQASSRFQVGECAGLGFKPRLAMRLTGKGQTKTGSHPGLKTVLTQKQGESNIGRVQVTLPRSVALDAVNSADPRLLCGYDESLKADCPASSVIGKATAHTPVLGKPLSGKVHLVQGIKFGPKGNRIRTTPALLVKLRGEVDINLRGTTTSRGGLLITNFDAVPDAPVSKFDLQINGGAKGILVVTRTRRSKINVCASKQTAQVKTTGHNGRQANYASTVKTPCAKSASKAKKARRSKANRTNRAQRG